jgi:alkylation response protein AidB-like acyl-CoA dehydrogenase
MAATAESVLKPDFKAQRKHFIFTDEHEQLRESITNFAIKELAPHAEEWEETTFPDSVFRRMGELGFLGLDKPEQYGGQGGDYFGADRHGDAADPQVRHRGAEAGMGRAGDQG